MRVCPEVVPRLEECHAVAKNTGSLADSDVANRTMIVGHWRRRSWTTSWCNVHAEPITRLGRLRRSALVLRVPRVNWGSSAIFMDSTHRRISLLRGTDPETSCLPSAWGKRLSWQRRELTLRGHPGLPSSPWGWWRVPFGLETKLLTQGVPLRWRPSRHRTRPSRSSSLALGEKDLHPLVVESPKTTKEDPPDTEDPKGCEGTRLGSPTRTWGETGSIVSITSHPLPEE